MNRSNVGKNEGETGSLSVIKRQTKQAKTWRNGRQSGGEQRNVPVQEGYMMLEQPTGGLLDCVRDKLKRKYPFLNEEVGVAVRRVS